MFLSLRFHWKRLTNRIHPFVKIQYELLVGALVWRKSVEAMRKKRASGGATWTDANFKERFSQEFGVRTSLVYLARDRAQNRFLLICQPLFVFPRNLAPCLSQIRMIRGNWFILEKRIVFLFLWKSGKPFDRIFN